MSMDSQFEQAIEWFNKGNAFQNQERWREAAHAFSEATRIKPDFGEAYDRLASMHAELGEYETAIKICLTALRLKPDDPNLYFNLASNYTQIDQDEKAVDAYRKCIALAPQDVEAHLYLNNCLGRLNRQEEAVQVLQKAVEIDASNIDVLHALGTKLRLLERPLEAIKFLQTLVELHEDNPEFQHGLGLAYISAYGDVLRTEKVTSRMGIKPEGAFDISKKNFLENALEAFQIAHKLRPRNADYIVGVGMTYAHMGEIEQALSQAKRLERIDEERYDDLMDIIKDTPTYRQREQDRRGEAEARRKQEEQRRQEEEERKRQQEAAAKAKQQAEEESRRAEEEHKRQEEEAERQRRIRVGLCVNCGKPLGFMDKMAKRQAHNNC